MTDRTPDVYLQAILSTLQGNDPGDVPPANWNYEQYLVAILNELRNGSGGDNRFIVTLTPTSEDYSGTMDKTVAEINAAYEAGQQIVFRVMTSATTYMDVDCTARYFDNGYTYPSFNAYIVADGGVLIYAFTNAVNDGTKQTYNTEIYSLTHAT